MSLSDIKLYIVNSVTFAVSFADIDFLLKSILVLLSIGYTIHKWIIMIRKQNK
jgi:hypothetical protein